MKYPKDNIYKFFEKKLCEVHQSKFSFTFNKPIVGFLWDDLSKRDREYKVDRVKYKVPRSCSDQSKELILKSIVVYYLNKEATFTKLKNQVAKEEEESNKKKKIGWATEGDKKNCFKKEEKKNN